MSSDTLKGRMVELSNARNGSMCRRPSALPGRCWPETVLGYAHTSNAHRQGRQWSSVRISTVVFWCQKQLGDPHRTGKREWIMAEYAAGKNVDSPQKQYQVKNE
jgi:hypothetical protein